MTVMFYIGRKDVWATSLKRDKNNDTEVGWAACCLATQHWQRLNHVGLRKAFNPTYIVPA
jgi:hypothetical protein